MEEAFHERARRAFEACCTRNVTTTTTTNTFQQVEQRNSLPTWKVNAAEKYCSLEEAKPKGKRKHTNHQDLDREEEAEDSEVVHLSEFETTTVELAFDNAEEVSKFTGTRAFCEAINKEEEFDAIDNIAYPVNGKVSSKVLWRDGTDHDSPRKVTWHSSTRKVGRLRRRNRRTFQIPDHIRRPENYIRYTLDEPIDIVGNVASYNRLVSVTPEIETRFKIASDKSNIAKLKRLETEERVVLPDFGTGIEFKGGRVKKKQRKVEPNSQHNRKWCHQKKIHDCVNVDELVDELVDDDDDDDDDELKQQHRVEGSLEKGKQISKTTKRSLRRKRAIDE